MSALQTHGVSKKKSRSAGKRPKSVLGKKKFSIPARGRLSVKMPDDASGIDMDASNKMTLDIKLSDDTAAVIIQKEVRKFLSNLGFYQAQ